MNITPEMKEAIKKAIDLHGNVTQFAKHLGIAHSTVLFWLSGKTTEVSGRLWAQKLRPTLLPFLGPSVFEGRALSKGFFQAQAAPLSETHRAAAGYVPWQSMDKIPTGAPVRLRHNGHVLGSLRLAIGPRIELRAESLVQEPNGNFQPHVCLACDAELGLELLEVQVGSEWIPAGKQLN